jgi:hypothetical protein
MVSAAFKVTEIGQKVEQYDATSRWRVRRIGELRDIASALSE